MTLIRFVVDILATATAGIAFTFGMRAIASTIVIELLETYLNQDLNQNKKFTSLIVKAVIMFTVAFTFLILAIWVLLGDFK